jgi:hypothetical protein
MIPEMELERNWYREDDISTKIYSSQNYESDFNSANNNVVYTQSPVTSSYIRVGKMVFVTISVDFSKVTSVGTGQYYITLPFQATRHSAFAPGMLHEGTIKRRSLQGVVEKESYKVVLYYLDNQSELASFDSSHPHNISSDDLFHFEGWYEAEVQL